MSALLEAIKPLWLVFAAIPPPANAEPPVLSPGQRLLHVVQQAVCYSVVVEYAGHRDVPPVPIGVIVLCPGKNYAKAWFHLNPVARVLLPRSKRWKTLHSYVHNLNNFPPRTLEHLESHIRGQHTQVPPHKQVLRFRPIEASLENPYRRTTTLYGEVMKASIELEEAKEAMEEAIESLTCPKCGDEHPRSLPCKPTLHRMVEKHLDKMDREDCLYWLQRVNEELPITRQALTVQLLCRYGILLAQGKPEQAREIEAFFALAQEILSV